MSVATLMQNWGSSSSYSSTLSAGPAKVSELLAAYGRGYTSSIPSASDVENVQISPAAQIAASDERDTTKTMIDLSAIVRAELDAQYLAARIPQETGRVLPDLSDLSARALAVVILDTSGTFSAQEIQTGRIELDDRTRTDLVNLMGLSPRSPSGLSSYRQRRAATTAALGLEDCQDVMTACNG